MARDAEATKERILDAAFTEFMDRGFAGARVDDIATRAGCNKALIYAHYGDKERLWERILECKTAELSKIEADFDRPAESVGRFFDFHAANPWCARLLMWEALNVGAGRIPNEDERRERFAQHVETIRDAQRRGAVDPGLDPKQTLITLIGLINYWFMSPATVRIVTGEDPYTPAALEERRTHILDVATKLLEVKA
jgi:AcrR family transcriptional regulator